MKLLLLADPFSSHTVKWANALNREGIEIFIFGLSGYNHNNYDENIKIEIVEFPPSVKKARDGNILKLNYLKAIPALKKYISVIKPDIIHAHYASSYGLLGALTRFHPFLISVWGSDVYLFPKKSMLHKSILKFSLSRADNIFSTSHAMKSEIQNYTSKEIEVVHFGIDTSIFKPAQVDSLFSKDDLVIGTVKSLEHNYGIKYLINAFVLLVEKHPALPIKLLIVGGGSMINFLKELIVKKKVRERTIFTGPVPFTEVPRFQNMLDIAVYPSVSESFGVSVLESSACEKPVVVSNVGGLPEVVKDGETGIIVEKQNPKQTAEAIEKLILNKSLREQLGRNGRQRVEKKYNFSENIEQMVEFYNNCLD